MADRARREKTEAELAEVRAELEKTRAELEAVKAAQVQAEYADVVERAKINRAKMAVKSLETAVEAYYLQHGEYPLSLAVLTQREVDGGKAYLDADALKTPWGSQYNYDPVGPSNGGNKPDIWADGPQGKRIGNWPAARSSP